MRSIAFRRLYPRRQEGLPCRVGVKMRRLCFSSPMRITRPNAPRLAAGAFVTVVPSLAFEAGGGGRAAVFERRTAGLEPLERHRALGSGGRALRDLLSTWNKIVNMPRCREHQKNQPTKLRPFEPEAGGLRLRSDYAALRLRPPQPRVSS